MKLAKVSSPIVTKMPTWKEIAINTMLRRTAGLPNRYTNGNASCNTNGDQVITVRRIGEFQISEPKGANRAFLTQGLFTFSRLWLS
jgi:hypothetical protein